MIEQSKYQSGQRLTISVGELKCDVVIERKHYNLPTTWKVSTPFGFQWITEEWVVEYETKEQGK